MDEWDLMNKFNELEDDQLIAAIEEHLNELTGRVYEIILFNIKILPEWVSKYKETIVKFIARIDDEKPELDFRTAVRLEILRTTVEKAE